MAFRKRRNIVDAFDDDSDSSQYVGPPCVEGCRKEFSHRESACRKRRLKDNSGSSRKDAGSGKGP